MDTPHSGLSDPRVRGVETLDIRYEFSSADTGVTWGTDRNVTAAGAWEGTWAGVMYSGPVNDISAWLRGSGAYAGLTYYYGSVGPDARATVKGLIYAGSPPPGQFTVPEGPLMVESEPAVVVRGRATCTFASGVSWSSCADQVPDPRVTGRETVSLQSTELGGQAALLWGTKVVHGPDGTWEGVWNGVRYPDGTYRMNGYLTGSGAYAGWVYWFSQTGTGRPSFALDGLIYRGSPVPTLAATTTVPASNGPRGPDEAPALVLIGLAAAVAAGAVLRRRARSD